MALRPSQLLKGLTTLEVESYSQLKDALNTVREVETPPGSGIWRFVRTGVGS
jgi:hypothetical protein